MILMSELSQVELQNLRHLIGAHDTSYQKLNTYASQCVDPQIKQMFTKAAQDSLNTKQKLFKIYFCLMKIFDITFVILICIEYIKFINFYTF